MAYKSFASGYLLKDGKVLLVHSRKYDKWVPPGGHIEPEETPDQAVVREFLEETGLSVRVVPAYANGIPGDAGRTPIPMPFHMGLYKEDFDVPHIGYFFFVALENTSGGLAHEASEHFDAQWYSLEDINSLATYQQVKNEARYVFEHYPALPS
jgi:8-oxo-dGTP diphosphatase